MNTTYPYWRSIYTVLLVCSVFFLPTPLSLLLLGYGFSRFSLFVEGIAAALLFDLLYQTSFALPGARADGYDFLTFIVSFSGTFLALFLFVSIEWLKGYLFLNQQGR